MAIPVTMMERIYDKISERSPFGISKLVTNGRIQERSLTILKILPPNFIYNTLQQANKLLNLAKKKSLDHTKKTCINIRIEAVEETMQMLRNTFERFHNSSYCSRTKRAWNKCRNKNNPINRNICAMQADSKTIGNINKY